MLPGLATQSVEVLAASAVTDHGNDTLDWSSPSSLAVSGCSFQPTAGSIDHNHRTGEQYVATLYMPPGTPITASNRVRFGGVTYELTSPPIAWETGLGLDHVEVHLSVWEG